MSTTRPRVKAKKATPRAQTSRNSPTRKPGGMAADATQASKTQAAIEQARSAAEQVLGANPVVGMTREELLDAARRLLKLLSLNPATVARKQAQFGVEMGRIMLGRSKITPDPKDRRFQHKVWHVNGYYRRVMQSYLAWSRSMREILASINADPEDMERAQFFLMQLTAAAAPTNNPIGNPGFLDSALRSKGLSIMRGLQNLINDMLHNQGMPAQVDRSPFKVGKNLAVSPGAVVFRNPVCEVIQYLPRTENVDATPVLIIPPQINKYYIVDLAKGKSFIEYGATQGQQMFCISWRNPTAAQRDWGLEAYVSAAEEAIDAVLEITGSESLKLMAACAGGITAAVILGHMTAIGEGHKVNSLTLLVTVLDTRAKTLLGLFANDTGVRAAIERSRKQGVLDGDQMSRAFAWLRPDDLVWGFVANNYIMGNQPPAFDILFWNNDTTRLPAQFHADLLRVFQQNPLITPGGMKMLGQPINLKNIECDVFIIAGITDHITPWNACYRATQMFGGEVKFVLSSSGHIQSIVNPPSNPKAKYFLNDDYSLPHEQWLEQSEVHDGTWWSLWLDWARKHSTGQREAPQTLGSKTYPASDPAPGRYVHQQ